ncbi:MAG: phosphatase [Alkalinema sp. RU_4_3]|nr:phosphatase [Alkalinema sp. RU_4_3]
MTSPLLSIDNFARLPMRSPPQDQPTPEEFSAIQAAGYRLVINLATPSSSNWNPDEQALVEKLGMEYISIPVQWDFPTLADYETLADLLDDCSDRKLWVHCARNWRVSAMIYLYQRLRQGLVHEVADRNLKAIWEPDEVWRKFIEAVVELYED